MGMESPNFKNEKVKKIAETESLDKAKEFETEREIDLKEFEEKALTFIEESLKEHPDDADKIFITEYLAGLDSDRAWKLREEALSIKSSKWLLKHPEQSVIGGLAGIDSDRAWELREKFSKKVANRENIADSLAGLDSDRAWAMREILKRQRSFGEKWSTVPNSDYRAMLKVETRIISGLAGVDSDKAWETREEYFGWDDLRGAVIESLAGLDTNRAWEMREELFKNSEKGDNEDMRALANSLIGLNTDRAWEFREKLLKNKANKNSIVASLVGIDTDRAWEMREESLKDGSGKGWVADSLVGLDSDRAWKLREEFSQNDSVVLAAQSLVGNNTSLVWRKNYKK